MGFSTFMGQSATSAKWLVFIPSSLFLLFLLFSWAPGLWPWLPQAIGDWPTRIFTRCTAVSAIDCIWSSPSEPQGDSKVSKLESWEEYPSFSFEFHSAREIARALWLPLHPLTLQDPDMGPWRWGWKAIPSDKHHDMLNIACSLRTEVFCVGPRSFMVCPFSGVSPLPNDFLNPWTHGALEPVRPPQHHRGQYCLFSFPGSSL